LNLYGWIQHSRPDPKIPVFDVVQQLHYSAFVPTIMKFGFCAIVVHSREHGIPHFHLVTRDGDRLPIAIDTLQPLVGRIDRRRFRDALDWAEENKALLNNEWEKLNP